MLDFQVHKNRAKVHTDGIIDEICFQVVFEVNHKSFTKTVVYLFNSNFYSSIDIKLEAQPTEPVSLT
jgi:hypothetical protein